MDLRQIQRFKVLLEGRQSELRLSIEHQQRSARTAEPVAEEVDQATSTSERMLLLGRDNREQGLLWMVEAALGRIQDGSFGQCLSCGNEIDTKRLQAVPWTRYCIRCQEDFERQVVSRGCSVEDRLASLLEELRVIGRWDEEYRRKESHTALDESSYRARQERRQETMREIASLCGPPKAN